MRELLILLITVMLIVPAYSSPIDDCRQAKGHKIQVQKCTQVIKNKKSSKNDIKFAYMTRSLSYSKSNKLIEAIEDAEALRAKYPNDPAGYMLGFVGFWDLNDISTSFIYLSHGMIHHYRSIDGGKKPNSLDLKTVKRALRVIKESCKHPPIGMKKKDNPDEYEERSYFCKEMTPKLNSKNMLDKSVIVHTINLLMAMR